MVLQEVFGATLLTLTRNGSTVLSQNATQVFFCNDVASFLILHF